VVNFLKRINGNMFKMKEVYSFICTMNDKIHSIINDGSRENLAVLGPIRLRCNDKYKKLCSAVKDSDIKNLVSSYDFRISKASEVDVLRNFTIVLNRNLIVTISQVILYSVKIGLPFEYHEMAV